MLKRQFILQNIYTKQYASKDEIGIIVFYTQDIVFAHLFDTKTEIYEFIKSTNKELAKLAFVLGISETGSINHYIIHEIIS